MTSLRTRPPSSLGPPPRRPPQRPRRRRRGVLLALAAVIAAAAAVTIVAISGSKGTTRHSVTATAPLPRPTSKITLTSPAGKPGMVGVAEIVRHGDNAAVAILGKGLPQNTKHNAYAVWLYNSSSDALRLGFVNPSVGHNGHLDTAGVLPPQSARYRELLITVETTSNPSEPGRVVLEGRLS